MEITTRKFVFSQRSFLRLQLRPFLTPQYLVLYGLTVAAWLVLLLVGLEWWLVCGLMVVTSIPLWPLLATLVFVWLAAPQNREFFTQKRSYTINEQHILVHTEDGMVQTVPFSEIARVVEVEGAYLLYMADETFTYMPKDIFRSVEDMARFEEILAKI